jgi:DNA-binding transcriptional ArsR family regulator
MTQQAFINALRDGPLSSHEVANHTGMTQATVVSTAKKLRDKGILSIGKIKVGKFWLAHYTLVKDDVHFDDGVKYICGIPTYGIFSKAEYAVMRQQAARLYGKQGKKEITNNQRI